MPSKVSTAEKIICNRGHWNDALYRYEMDAPDDLYCLWKRHDLPENCVSQFGMTHFAIGLNGMKMF
jgi:hypothetical protein